jgi:lysophospholipid acyltransferase (LPLAT)-like uncharacterized protein
MKKRERLNCNYSMIITVHVSTSYIIRKLITTLGEQLIEQLLLRTRRSHILESASGNCLGCEVSVAESHPAILTFWHPNFRFKF